MINFLDNIKKEYIKNFIRIKILPNLNIIEYNIIIDKLCLIIDYITVRFSINPSKYNDFWHQLNQNNSRDIIAIFNLLFPYIDDKEGTYKLHHEIRNLSDISEKKYVKLNKILDESKNNYLITNIKYNLSNNQIYNIQIFNHNLLLLLITIDQISNKLFVNWLNIIPLTLTNYKQSYLYENRYKLFTIISNDISDEININYINTNNQINKNIFKYNTKKSYFLDSNNKKLEDTINIINNNKINREILLNNKGLSLNDIFNTIYYDLFYDISKIKWLIYQDTFENPDYDEIYIKKFNELIAIPGLYNNIIWNELLIEEQLLFKSNWANFLTLVITNKSAKRNTYYNLLKSIIIFMERNYDKINAITKQFNYIKITTDTEFDTIDDDDNNKADDIDNELNEISADELILRITVIPYEDLYLYLLDCIQKFIPTWYGRNIILKYDPKNKLHNNYNKPGIYIENLNNFKFNYNSYIEEDIKKDKIKQEYNKPLIFPENLNIKYKFFYNYAKAFSIIYHDDKSYPRQIWKNMNIKNRVIMVKFLNFTYNEAIESNNRESENIDHFNVMSFQKYYQRTYSNSILKYKKALIFDKQSNNYIINLDLYIGDIIFDLIKKNIVDITHEIHIMKGLLNEFVINPNLTDNTYLGINNDDRRKNQFANIKKYVFNESNLNNYANNAFYFLTNSPYSELNDIYRGSKKSYFELISSEYRWYSFYSMDWVAQINFYHRYINNRVIYITGATGQGKSTQIPKLFLYSLKMIDRKTNGKIICSQPRIKPTTDNSEQISYELGLPLLELSINYKQNIKTFNPYIQYKTQNDSHEVSNNIHNGLILKLVTDRLLLMDLLKSPIFKEIEKPYRETYIDHIEFNKYTKNNIYDIIMVDESHEHNINMDIILTIARDTIKYNNSLKLVIISATMEEDEPIYRRYYKEIDDNFLYPYNNLNGENNFDRCSIDRRIHISPPGETTQYKVIEKYLEIEPNNYAEAEILAITKALEIAHDKNTTGDILLFSLGEADIKRICKKINSELPINSDIICIPFYRELPKKWTTMNQLTKLVKQITVNRNDLFDEIYPKENNNIPKKVPLNTYKRAIVVATNIAEASITINTLKYVIDTGYHKSANYTIEDDSQIFKDIKITESSRIQRKGRVGRVSSGIVYYMYKINSRKDIKLECSICISNILDNLLELMPKKYDDKLLIPNIYWDKLIKTNNDAQEAKSNFDDDYLYFITSKMFKNLLIYQYTYLNTFTPSIINFMTKFKTTDINNNAYNESYNIDLNKLNAMIIGPDNISKIYIFSNKYIYDRITSRPPRHITGYNIKECIYDLNGNFYIIHPDEIKLKRNLLTGNIINKKKLINDILDNTFKNKDIPITQIISHKVYLYMQRCINLNLLINHNLKTISKQIFLLNNSIEFNKIEFQYEKSNIGILITSIIPKINILINQNNHINYLLITTIIYGYVYNIDHLIIIMILLMKHSNYQLKGLNPNYKIFINMFSADDLFIYYNLALKIYNKIKLLAYFNNYNEIIFNKEKKQYLIQKQKIKNDMLNKSNYWYLDIGLDIYNKFNILSNTNKLDQKQNMSDYINESIKNTNKKNLSSFVKILKECFIVFDQANAEDMLKEYLKLINIFNTLKNIDNNQQKEYPLLWFKYNMQIKPSLNEYINIKKTFIYTFGLLQTIMYNPNKNNYVDLNLLHKQYSASKDTLTSLFDIGIYIYKQPSNNISILINSDIDTLTECNLVGFNPINKYILSVYDNIETNQLLNKFLNKYLNIYSNKYKYIGHLRTSPISHPNLKDDFYKLNNNNIEYIIKLWTSEFNSNYYYIIDTKNQIGGLNYNKLIQIKLKKIPNLLSKLNINIFEFYNLLSILNENKLLIYINNNYLCIK